MLSKMDVPSSHLSAAPSWYHNADSNTGNVGSNDENNNGKG